MEAFFYYYGGKFGAARHYPKPINKRIIEPFAGSAGYSCYYSSCDYDSYEVILNDKDPIVAGIWDYLIHVKKSEFLKLPDCVDAISKLKGIPLEAQCLIGHWLGHGPNLYTKISKRRKEDRSNGLENVWGPGRKNIIAGQLKYIRKWKESSHEEA